MPRRQGVAVVVRVDALLVHGVAGLMDGAEKRVAQIVLVHPGGDAHVAQRKTGGEGMGGLILAAALEVIAQALDHVQAEGQLLRLRVRLVQADYHRPEAGR